jgi:imidazolonepropionase-like amidohydrolase
MRAVRAARFFDGEQFGRSGATVLVADGKVAGVEAYEFEPPAGCPVLSYAGTLLPGLIDAHTHLVTDSGPMALDRVAGYSAAEIETVMTRALHDHLAAGVTTVRDLGDRDFSAVGRRDRQRGSDPVAEPNIVASGPPITAVGGHCHYLGGAVAGAEQIRRAIDERAQRNVDVVKVMASSGANTPGSDVMSTQFTDSELRLMVELAHNAGLPLTAHAHGTPAVEQAIAAGVDGIEHCSCVTNRGAGDVADATLATLARSQIAVCPTLGLDPAVTKTPPPQLLAMVSRMGLTLEQWVAARAEFTGRLHRAGVRLISGVDSGINPAKRHGTLPHAVLDLEAAGLTIAQALATATSAAANALGLPGKGRVAAGRDADFLIVNGELADNPEALLDPRRDPDRVAGGIGHCKGGQPERAADSEADQVAVIEHPGGGQMVPGPRVQHKLQAAHAGEGDHEAVRVASQGSRRADGQADAQQDCRQDGDPVRGIIRLVPICVEGELDPEPPDRNEEHDKAAERTQGLVVLERARELADGSSERQVEEKLNPASAALFSVVAVGGPQSRTRQAPHHVAAARATGRPTGWAWSFRCRAR